MDVNLRVVCPYLIVAILIIGFMNNSFAQTQQISDPENSPLMYDVTITLMDISDIDYENGGYSLSFWIKLYSEDIDFTLVPPPEIDFVNGKIDEIVHEYTDKNSYSAKVYGTFFTNMNFRNYPLMHLSLPIIIEPVQQPVDEIKFVSGKVSSNIDENLTVSGLLFKQVKIDTLDYTYFDGDVFSRYIVTFEFETPILTSFLVGIFPILVLAGLVVFLFGLDPRNHDLKAEMVVGVLIAAVFFHVIDVGESLPPLTYLTLEDKVITILYGMLGVIMVEIISQRKWNPEDDLQKAEKIDKKFRMIFVVVSTAIAIIVFLLRI